MSTGTLDSIWQRQVERLRTGRGIAASAFAAFIALDAVANSRHPGGALFAMVIFLPVIWWMSWWVVGLFIGMGRQLAYGSPPLVRVGRQWQSSGSTRQQLRTDSNARFFEHRGGLLLRKRIWFVASGTPVFEIPQAIWNVMAKDQEIEPQFVADYRDRCFWWYNNSIYWTNVAYSADDIRALLFARQRKHKRELEHAHAILAASTSPATHKRTPIPKDIKRAVWERDEGLCVECGSDFDLQYDHVIPVAMGGASTVENLQLLCAACNQSKGGRL
jgi:HNH endonuclease